MDNVLNMVVTTDEGTFYCQIKPEESQGIGGRSNTDRPSRSEVDRPYSAVHASDRKGSTATYNDATTDKTTFTLPYTPVDEVLAVVQYENATYKGLLLGTTSDNGVGLPREG